MASTQIIHDSKYDYPETKVELRGQVAVVYMDRPAKLNAWTGVMNKALQDIFEKLDEDDRIKVVVVTGTGDRAYCAGADLSQGDFSSRGDKSRYQTPTLGAHRDGGGQFSIQAAKMRKPVIAAINGVAVGVGITSTLPMDIRITYKEAKIGFVFVRRGIVPEATSTYWLPRLVGYSRAVALMLTGRVYKASDPLLANLFTEVLDNQKDVLPRALELANEMASMNSSVSMAMVKGLLWHGTNTPEEQHLLDSKGMFALGNSIDGKEGVASFMQKRQVKFQGTVTKDMPVFYPWWTHPDASAPKSSL
ncbi:hypothetical protein SmJEL517_g00045 [Synchytrium microbalum]|uniref:Enoyl-CoA hydratase n=1 Tax=Synchytrium microbalum TaxID=1806994 RepID=A0A507C8X8_9FUNG|nr:uncharacterized protein SmJEL517_g00045 [Synchytrium microbalum]TPX38040.1 hypothetical protein SmJEL517_g00045 [Synchytrium microbalum]